jgi:hypothetical protein
MMFCDGRMKEKQTGVDYIPSTNRSLLPRRQLPYTILRRSREIVFVWFLKYSQSYHYSGRHYGLLLPFKLMADREVIWTQTPTEAPNGRPARNATPYLIGVKERLYICDSK